MSAEQECECKQQECETGAPAWVMTFADLMSLLMCFFVLLLSFSEMDVIKFKQIAGSMKSAFGVQRQVQAPDIPMGTSIITQEFSPGKTEPTIVQDVRQTTTQEDVSLESAKEKMEEAAQEAAKELKVQMAEQIDQGLVEVDSEQDRVIIRIKEKGSFPSGSAELREEFLPILEKIRAQIATTPGTITVAGHTDDIPIRTFRYRSNWELSSSRAVSVLEQLLADGTINAADTEVKGLADTQPLVPNDSPENRATNRRVEIVISPALKPAGENDTLQEVGGAEMPQVEGEAPQQAEEPPSIIPPLPPGFDTQPGAEEPLPQPETTEQPSIIPPLPPGFDTQGGAEEPLPQPETTGQPSIVDGAVSPGGEPIVIQDDAEVPALQPELTQEIQDLFGTLENQ